MNILQTGNPRLKEKSRKIPLSEITGKEIKKILRDMKETLRKEPQGIGLAAIQIGIPKNIFIVSKYVLDPESFPEKEDAEKLKLKKEKKKKKKKTKKKKKNKTSNQKPPPFKTPQKKKRSCPKDAFL